MSGLSSNSKSPQLEPPISFEWIDERQRKQDANSPYRTAIRSHVKKAFYKDRRSKNRASKQLRELQKAPVQSASTTREDRGLNFESSKDMCGGIVANLGLCMSAENRAEGTHEASLEPQEDINFPDAGLLSRTLSGSSRKYLHQRLFPPQTVLGQGRVDPFNTYAIDETKPYMHRLIDYHAWVCSWMPKEPGAELGCNYTRWLPLCMENRMSFQSLLLSAEASSRGKLGLGAWSTNALTHSLECTRLLNKELDTPHPKVTDQMIATVINIAMVELIWGEQAKYRNHLDGLMAMVNLRGGLDKLGIGMGTYMKHMIIWISFLGGNLTGTIPQVIGDEPSGPKLYRTISRNLFVALRSIRALTVAQAGITSLLPDTAKPNFPKICLDLQLELESLQSRTPISFLQEPCCVAAILHIDLVLLKTPAMKLPSSKAYRRLHQLIMQSKIPRTLVENDDILRWISAVAAATIGMNLSQKTSLIHKFNSMLQRLESLKTE